MAKRAAMKAWLYYALAAATLAAPLGYIIAAMLDVLDTPAAVRGFRPYPLEEYMLGAFVAALVVFFAVLFVGKASCSKARSGSVSE
jgi:hypothetical protein